MKSKIIYSSIARVTPLYDFFLWLVGYKGSVDYFVSQLPFEKGQRFKVLDAGCGTGLYSLAILRQYPNAQVTAFDLNEKLAKRLEYKLHQRGLRGRASLFVSDVQDNLRQLGEKKFDLIITSGVLEYVNIDVVVTNLSRFLVPGGYFAHSPINDNFLGRLIGWLSGCQPYSRARNFEAFTQVGLAPQKICVPKSFREFKELHIFRR